MTPAPPAWTPPRPLPAALRTDRLILRFLEPADAPSLLEAIDINRDSLHPWLPWARTENRSLAECIYTIEHFRRERERPTPVTFLIGIVDGRDGSVVGGTSFHRVRAEVGEAEIGYWIRADRRGRGLCTEAAAALISWGFTAQLAGWGFRRITMFCAEPNTASKRVAQKLGLRRELHARGDRWVDGIGFCDSLGWGVLADEWETRAHRLKPA